MTTTPARIPWEPAPYTHWNKARIADYNGHRLYARKVKGEWYGTIDGISYALATTSLQDTCAALEVVARAMPIKRLRQPS